MGAMFMSKLTVLLVIVFGFFISVSMAGQQKITRSTGDSIELSRYELVSRIDVEEVDDDLSGLTFNPLTESLFAVTNEPPQLIEMSLEGRVIRLIPLLGFEDTEGITHVQGNQFALVEERKRQVVFFSVDESTTKIEHEHCEVYALAMKGEKNKGLEGIAWRDGAGLLLAKEDEPEQLYQLAANNQFERGLTVLLQRSETPRSLGDCWNYHRKARSFLKNPLRVCVTIRLLCLRVFANLKGSPSQMMDGCILSPSRTSCLFLINLRYRNTRHLE